MRVGVASQGGAIAKERAGVAACAVVCTSTAMLTLSATPTATLTRTPTATPPATPSATPAATPPGHLPHLPRQHSLTSDFLRIYLQASVWIRPPPHPRSLRCGIGGKTLPVYWQAHVGGCGGGLNTVQVRGWVWGGEGAEHVVTV